jgi:hypothetical protein
MSTSPSLDSLVSALQNLISEIRGSKAANTVVQATAALGDLTGLNSLTGDSTGETQLQTQLYVADSNGNVAVKIAAKGFILQSAGEPLTFVLDTGQLVAVNVGQGWRNDSYTFTVRQITGAEPGEQISVTWGDSMPTSTFGGVVYSGPAALNFTGSLGGPSNAFSTDGMRTARVVVENAGGANGLLANIFGVRVGTGGIHVDEITGVLADGGVFRGLFSQDVGVSYLFDVQGYTGFWLSDTSGGLATYSVMMDTDAPAYALPSGQSLYEQILPITLGNYAGANVQYLRCQISNPSAGSDVITAPGWAFYTLDGSIRGSSFTAAQLAASTTPGYVTAVPTAPQNGDGLTYGIGFGTTGTTLTVVFSPVYGG